MKKSILHRHENPRPVRRVKPIDHDHRSPETKSADSLVCDDCGVVQHGGRWHWGAPAIGFVHGGRCPACETIRSGIPGGTLRIPMPRVDSTNEVMQLVRTAATAEREEHPLERLMDVVERGGELVVTTTGIHLARRLATQLQRRFHEKPKVHYSEDDTVTVVWSAPAPARGRAKAARGTKAAKAKAARGKKVAARARRAAR